MLQITGHGKDVFDQQYQSAVTEFINREKKCIRKWEIKYKKDFEKKWEEHKKRYLNKKTKVGRTIGSIGSTSEPTVRCIGWGISKLDRRTAQKEIARGGLSHMNDGEEHYSKPVDFKKSEFGRTKALSTAFYDTNGIYAFGGDVIKKQGEEIEKVHNREILRIENLRRRMGMGEHAEDNTRYSNKANERKEFEEHGELKPALSDISDPIEDDLEDLESFEDKLNEKQEVIKSDFVNEEKSEEEKHIEDLEELKLPEGNKKNMEIPNLSMDKLLDKMEEEKKEIEKPEIMKSEPEKSKKLNSSRNSSRRSSRNVKKKKKESVFDRLRNVKGKKKTQKKSAFNSFGNPLYPRFKSTSSCSSRSTRSSKYSVNSTKSGKMTPRHRDLMRKLEMKKDKEKYMGSF